MLVILGGLPGSGKTTIARQLARDLQAVHIRIDSIEQALRNGGFEIAGPEGYIAAWATTEDLLRGGHTVIADSVNPIEFTRAGWRRTARQAGSPAVEIHIVCGARDEHRQRAESRVADIEGHELPSWEQILGREFEPWPSSTVLDTAGQSLPQSVAKLRDILSALGNDRGESHVGPRP